MAEQSLLCWGCGKEPPDGVKFQRCMRCAEAKLPSSYFCGEECMLANWPRHKAWHMQQKERVSIGRSHAHINLPERDRLMTERVAQRAKNTGSEYGRLLAQAMSRGTEGDFQGSVRVFRKCIKMRPEVPDAYANLALVLVQSNNMPEASQLYLKSMELHSEGTEPWAAAAATVTALLMLDDCCDVPKPEWWNDEGLKALSAQLVTVLPITGPHYSNACMVRAQVLASGVLGAAAGVRQRWEVGMRTAEEIKEAAVWSRRHAALKGGSHQTDEKDFAGQCDKMADAMQKMADAKASSARAAAEAEAAEARKAAEAKAATAAEELLAEEEKEKEQAATKDKAGKAKGKGKKGKGKRS